MPTRKTASSTGKSTRTATKVDVSRPTGPLPPYGDPIRQAIASGDIQVMRKVAASTRHWLKDISTLLTSLERQIEKVSIRK